jgi:hypothetical protein
MKHAIALGVATTLCAVGAFLYLRTAHRPVHEPKQPEVAAESDGLRALQQQMDRVQRQTLALQMQVAQAAQPAAASREAAKTEASSEPARPTGFNPQQAAQFAAKREANMPIASRASQAAQIGLAASKRVCARRLRNWAPTSRAKSALSSATPECAG